MNQMSINGRIAVVTGGARGMGRSIAMRLAQDGAAVAVWDINPEGAEQTAAAIAQAGGVAIACVGDASLEEEITGAVTRTRSQLGPVTILVNNAGAFDVCAFPEIKADSLDRLLNINLRGPFICTQAVIPDMLAAGWGRIVNISSAAAQSGAKGSAHYAASKGGIIGLTKALAMEYVDKGITVNHIPPGMIDTPMSGRTREQTAALAAAYMPMKRPGRPEEVAAACSYLVSDAAGYVTGQTLSVNGGYYLC
jgi:2-hydroxycyclohexanecarboxyl-CoA dehydrogenase